MLKLTPKQKKRLNAILATNRMLSSDDADKRKTFLGELNMLEYVEGVDWRAPTVDFIPGLRARLASLTPPRESEFIRNFLDYCEDDLSPDDLDYLNEILPPEDEPVACSRPKEGFDKKPDAGRLKHSIPAYIEDLIKFDLEIIVPTFLESLALETGVFSFSFSTPDRAIAEEYVAERLCWEFVLKYPKRNILWPALSLTLPRNNLDQAAHLHTRLREKLKTSVHDWFQQDKTRDLMVCIWNDGEEERKMKDIAQKFWHAVLDDCADMIEKRGQRLLVLWGNTYTDAPVLSIPADRFFPLNPLREFCPAQTKKYWKNYLETENFSPDAVDRHLNDIKDCGGNLTPTFRCLKRIINAPVQ